MLIDSPRFRRQLGWIAAFALPVAAVKIAGMFSMDIGPATTLAAEATAANGQSAADTALRNIKLLHEPPQFTQDERSVRDRMTLLLAEPLGPTPMLHAMPQQEPSENNGEVVAPVDQKSVPPNIQLQAILSGSDTTEAMALINGRPHIVGQPIADTAWILAEIHPDERRIVIVHPDLEQSVTYKLRTQQ